MNVLARSASEEMSKPADQTRLTHSMPYNDDEDRPTEIPLCAEEREKGLHKSDKNQRERHKQKVLLPQRRRGRTASERKKEGRKKRDATMKMNQSEHIKEATRRLEGGSKRRKTYQR